MTDDGESIGWAWFEDRPSTPIDPVEHALCRAFARCFASSDGCQVADHLKRLILDRRLPPNATDAELRHLEGQRSAVAYLLGMVERGRA